MSYIMYKLRQGELKTETERESISNELISKCFSFKQSDINNADRFELWASSFNDAGDDFTELRLFKNNFIVKQIKQQGY